MPDKEQEILKQQHSDTNAAEKAAEADMKKRS